MRKATILFANSVLIELTAMNAHSSEIADWQFRRIQGGGEYSFYLGGTAILEGSCKVLVDRVPFSDGRAEARTDTILERPLTRRFEDLRTEYPERNSHVLDVTAPDSMGSAIGFTLTIKGGDAFPCTAMPRADEPAVVRAVSGKSKSLLNDTIYSREGDWALTIEGAEDLRIVPEGSRAGLDLYRVEGRSETLRIIFRPRFFRDHRGIPWFDSAQWKPRPFVPAGWIYWKAYGAAVTEQEILGVAEWAAEKLAPYGLEYITVDDGWFHGSDGKMMHNVPGNVDWTRANERFRGGVAHLTGEVNERGLRLGLWLSPFGFSGNVGEHPDWWVRQRSGGDVLTNV